MFPIFAGNSASTGYNLTRSLRTRASASGYLNRTPATTTNQKTWTWSGWVKRGTLGQSGGSSPYFFVSSSAGTDAAFFAMGFNGDAFTVTGYATNYLTTSAVYRDPAAWYHIVVAVDTSQATTSNRIKVYVNGTQVTAFSTANYVSLNFNTPVNLNQAHYLSAFNIGAGATNFNDLYLAEVNFVDGLQLTPSSFGSTNALTGVWQPAPYTGSYGTNGFILDFEDNSALTTSSNVGLGKDTSGNGNYWTTNNISITAGVTYDSMTDVPTLTSATAANYCVANAVNAPTNSAITNGNLTVDGGGSAQYSFAQSTFTLTSGTYYFEATLSTATATSNGLGLLLPTVAKNISTYSTSGVYAINWGNTNQISSITNGGTAVTISTTNWANGDIIQVAYNATNGNIWFGRNGTWYPATNGGTVGDPAANTNPTVVGVSGLTPTAINYGNGTKWDLNFGQRPFSYTPPTGYVALNTYNLPTSTIVKGNTVMDATLYTGNGSTQTITNAAAFKPDLVWIKGRSSSSQDHTLVDSVRGVSRRIRSNATTAEVLESGFTVTAFNSSGFTAVDDTNGGYNVNGSIGGTFSGAALYVGWQWQAGQGSTSSNTNGTITSTVSVNASAGFSVVTYTGTNTATNTVGHGLGVAPTIWLIKNRTSGSGNWVYNYIYSGAVNYAFLNSTNAGAAQGSPWSTLPTSSVITLGGSDTNTCAAGNNYVMYAWTPIAGFSAFGSYTGNGSADGPFVYTNFQPKFVLIKASSTTSQWVLWDAARNTYNVTNSILYPNLSAAETSFSIDILSNGFKFRESGGAGNDSGVTYIYAAFASNPFKNSLAR